MSNDIMIKAPPCYTIVDKAVLHKPPDVVLSNCSGKTIQDSFHAALNFWKFLSLRLILIILTI